MRYSQAMVAFVNRGILFWKLTGFSVCLCVVCTWIYTYTYIYTHTHTHIYTFILSYVNAGKRSSFLVFSSLLLSPAFISPGLSGSNLWQAKKLIRAHFWKLIKNLCFPSPHHPRTPPPPQPPTSCILYLPFSFHYSLFLWSIYHSPAIYFSASLSPPPPLHPLLSLSPPLSSASLVTPCRPSTSTAGWAGASPAWRTSTPPTRRTTTCSRASSWPRRSSKHPHRSLSAPGEFLPNWWAHYTPKQQKQLLPMHHKPSVSTLSWQTRPVVWLLFSPA